MVFVSVERDIKGRFREGIVPWNKGIKHLDIENPLDRFLRRVNIGKPNQCWDWRGARTPFGHGQFWYIDKLHVAHRWLYEYLFGKIQKDLDCHHTCENPSCVNPFHLQLVTRKQHIDQSPRTISHINKKKLSCLQGHKYTYENTWVDSKGYRRCKQCLSIQHHEQYMKNKEIYKKRVSIYYKKNKDRINREKRERRKQSMGNLICI